MALVLRQRFGREFSSPRPSSPGPDAIFLQVRTLESSVREQTRARRRRRTARCRDTRTSLTTATPPTDASTISMSTSISRAPCVTLSGLRISPSVPISRRARCRRGTARAITQSSIVVINDTTSDDPTQRERGGGVRVVGGWVPGVLHFLPRDTHARARARASASKRPHHHRSTIKLDIYHTSN